ncbi:hypothetical protein J43TS3_20750 [Ornithinibacillus bavariensis]|uniref:Uncharacterized protein n=1 Tax=Ornithinibacillus bavariensis TaxID=545502 RepID=A0A919X9D8_9BACI|nr:hypothetical protein J43TS3_20750 [Ornithinibacillus bavariensis]
MNKQDQLNMIKEDFINCQKVLLAIGDETRQSILLVLMGTDCQSGLLVKSLNKHIFLDLPCLTTLKYYVMLALF